MSTDDLDSATLAEYRRVIEQAAATSPDARAAAAHIFAALDRRDAREREMLAIVRELSLIGAGIAVDIDGEYSRCVLCGARNWVNAGASCHLPACPVTRARALLAR